VAAVRRVLKKADISAEALQSGTGIEDNCSGKHAGMLALAKMLGHPLEGYRATDHPIQTAILETVSEMCGLAVAEIRVGTDGCGAPIFAMPLENMALAFARLANPEELPPARAAACRAIVAAMQAHPELVGGLAWKDITGDRIVGKSGAAGCYCAGFVGRGAGCAMKIDDGSGAASLPALFRLLERNGYVSEAEGEGFLAENPLTIRNRAGETCGALELVF
jgi:L-asparaginase II